MKKTLHVPVGSFAWNNLGKTLKTSERSRRGVAKWPVVFEILIENWRDRENGARYVRRLKRSRSALGKADARYFGYAEAAFRIGWDPKPHETERQTLDAVKNRAEDLKIPYADGLGPQLYKQAWRELLTWCKEHGGWKGRRAFACTQLLEELGESPQAHVARPSAGTMSVEDVLRQEHVAAFYPSRDYYSTREAGSSIDSYISLATHSLVLVSISLATGVQMEDIATRFHKMLSSPEPTLIIVSLLDPKHRGLMEGIGPVLGAKPAEISRTIRDTFEKLTDLRASLPAAIARNLHLRVHRALPNASAILIDHRRPEGRIQLESKPYRAGMKASYAFEVLSGSKFYTTLADSYERLLADGMAFDGDESPLNWLLGNGTFKLHD